MPCPLTLISIRVHHVVFFLVSYFRRSDLIMSSACSRFLFSPGDIGSDELTLLESLPMSRYLMNSFLPLFFESLNKLKMEWLFTSKRSLDLTLLHSLGDFCCLYLGDNLEVCFADAILVARGVSSDTSNCGRADSLFAAVENGVVNLVILGWLRDSSSRASLKISF